MEDIYFISRRGDRLDLYANKYYQDASKWRIIATANHLGKGTLAVPPGLQIRIPRDPDEAYAELQKQNKDR